MRKLQGAFKLCLTGTPLENSIAEYYSIMDLALPGLLPELTKKTSTIDDDTLKLIAQRTKPFVLRRTKELILKELPPKMEQDIYLPMTDMQKKLYSRVTQEISLYNYRCVSFKNKRTGNHYRINCTLALTSNLHFTTTGR